MDSEMLYLNGEFMPLSEGRVGVEDRGFQLGDGVYEVIKVMNGRLVWLDDHLTRLVRNLGEVSLAQALRGHDLEAVLPEVVARSGVVEGFAYVQVTRGYAPREFVFPHPPHPTVVAYARSKSAPTVEEILAGTMLHPVEDLRWARCDIKTTNLLPAVLAKEEARQAGAHEALFVSADGVVREGGSSNVFAFLGGVLRTHPLGNRILAGITRKHVIEYAHRKGYEVEERAFTLPEVTTESDSECEVFSASTTRDVMPVVRIGSHTVGDGRPGPVTLALLDIMRREEALLVGLEPPAALS
ncbi:MAG: aminotransferase class IV [Thermoleophilia bacterium]|nr:aminotransferase class IV [Thermoleophilia bacterium]